VESERLNSIMYKLQKSAVLSDQELKDLQTVVDQLEQRTEASHADSVQSSHFHTTSLELAAGREAAKRGG
jgi:hypothetical protein